MNRRPRQNRKSTGKGRGRGLFRRKPPEPARTSPLLAGAGLGMLSTVSAIAATLERNPTWRLAAMISSGLSALTAMLVMVFRQSTWVQWPVRASLVSNFITGGRLHMRYSRKKR